MRLISDDIVDILAQAKIGTLGQDLFVAPPIPVSPDLCMSVWDTGSSNEPDSNYLDYRYPTFQVRIRGRKNNRKEAAVLCQRIRDCLHYWMGIVEGSRYLYILVMSEATSIGEDDLHRSMFSINFRAQRTPTKKG